MATFNNNESGSSVRTKINNVLQHMDGTSGEVVVNDAGADVDFRVESDTVTNALFVQGSSGNVGIGTSSPTANLQVGGSSGGDRTFQMYSAGATRGVFSTDGVNGILNVGCTNDSTSGRIAFRTGAALTERMRIDESGNVGIGTTAPTNLLDVNADSIRVRTAQTPATAGAAGNQGEIAWDADYIYVCVATNTWKRVAIATW